MRVFSALALAAVVGLWTGVAGATTIVRGPFLQMVGTTEATVVFELSDSADAALLVRGDSLDELRLPAAEASRHHEIRVTGLEPDEEYRYAVEVTDGQNRYREYSFRTAVAAGSPFTALLVGDTRSGHGVHESLVAAMLAEGAQLMLNTGDLVADGEEEDQWDVFFAIEHPLGASVPLYPVVGNHDTYQGKAPIFRDVFALPGRELYYSFDHGNAHFVMLDGHASVDLLCMRGEQMVLNCFDEEQLTWLESDLDAACEQDETDWIFVAVHEGPYSSKDDRYGSSQMRELLPLLKEHGVTAIFSGHDHYYERGVSDNGIPYVISGGGGAGLYDLAEPCAFPHTVFTNSQVHHYATLEVGPEQVHLTTKTAAGEVIDDHVFTQRKSCGASSTPEPAPPAEPPASDGGCRTAPGRSAPLGAMAAAVALLGLGWTWRRRRITDVGRRR